MLNCLLLINSLALAQQPTATEQEPASEEPQGEESSTSEESQSKTEENSSSSTKKSPETNKVESLSTVDVYTKPARVMLINGNQLNGSIPEELTAQDAINIEIEDGVTISLPANAIQEVSYKLHKFKNRDHAHRRYFFSSSAIPMPVKTGQITQTQLLATTAKYSPVENVALSAGTSLPISLYAITEPSAFLATTGIQYSASVLPSLFLGIGFDALFLGGASISMPYLTATVGQENTHFTARVGGGFETFRYMSLLPLQFSFYHRFTERIAFISESWYILQPSVIPDYNYDAPLYEGPCFEEVEDCYEATYSHDFEYAEAIILQMTGVRLIYDRFVTDLGLMIVSDGYDSLPLPWIDFAWKIGK